MSRHAFWLSLCLFVIAPRWAFAEDPPTFTTSAQAKAVAELAALRVEPALECMAEQHRKNDKNNEKIRELSKKVGEVVQQKQQALEEMARGDYCNQCWRTETEIEAAEKKPFEQHLQDVDGERVPAPANKMQEKARQFDKKIESVRKQIGGARKAYQSLLSQWKECEGQRQAALREQAHAEASAKYLAQREAIEEARKRWEAEVAAQAERAKAAQQEREERDRLAQQQVDEYLKSLQGTGDDSLSGVLSALDRLIESLQQDMEDASWEDLAQEAQAFEEEIEDQSQAEMAQHRSREENEELAGISEAGADLSDDRALLQAEHDDVVDQLSAKADPIKEAWNKSILELGNSAQQQQDEEWDQLKSAHDQSQTAFWGEEGVARRAADELRDRLSSGMAGVLDRVKSFAEDHTGSFREANDALNALTEFAKKELAIQRGDVEDDYQYDSQGGHFYQRAKEGPGREIAEKVAEIAEKSDDQGVEFRLNLIGEFAAGATDYALWNINRLQAQLTGEEESGTEPELPVITLSDLIQIRSPRARRAWEAGQNIWNNFWSRD